MSKRLALSLIVALAMSACVQTPQPVTEGNSALTHGNVQTKIEIGQTTQTDILEAFGAPNVTTIDGTGQEVWSYQRAATVEQDSSNYNYWTVILAGSSQQASGFERTQRTMTLIIKFDDSAVVSDFRSRSSQF